MENAEKSTKPQVDIVLIFPQLGSFDDIVRDIPLSLIYAAADSVKHGYAVKIIDLRVHPDSWKEELDAYVSSGCGLIGLSVMTGNPITTSLRISKYIKSKYRIPIVWGGAHPTILPKQTLENEYVDYIIRDWGSKSLFELMQYIKGESSQIDTILGLGYKKHGEIILNQVHCKFEMLHYRDLPYDLVDINSANYNRLSNGEVILPIFTAMGCPYKCTFCMGPAVYDKIKGKKWMPVSNEEVLEHIEYLAAKYEFHRLQIYDDDSFVDLDKLREFLVGYVKKGFHTKFRLDFRGARVNELDKMDDDLYGLMVHANVELLAIGAESGSNRCLKKMKKGITVEQTIRVNRKFAKYPSLRPHYNFFCGIPGETMEDLVKTKELILQLVRDNPNCYLGVGADWKPLPGSEMTDEAVKYYGLKLPERLEDWAAIDTFDAAKIVHPWYTREINNMIRLLQISGQLLDKKIRDFRKDMGVFGNLAYLASIVYRPILLLRLRFNFTGLLLEGRVMTFALHRLGKSLHKRGEQCEM